MTAAHNPATAALKTEPCAGCTEPILHAWGIDNWPLVLDPTPVTLAQAWSDPADHDDEYVLCYLTDPEGPMAVHGINPNRHTLMPWGETIPAGATRYRDHLCPSTQVAA